MRIFGKYWVTGVDSGAKSWLLVKGDRSIFSFRKFGN